MSRQVAHHALGAQLGESPVWCSRTARLWFVDIRAPAVLSLDPEAGRLERYPMADLTGMVALAESGLVVGVGCSIFRFDPTTGQLGDTIATLDPDRPRQPDQRHQGRPGRRALVRHDAGRREGAGRQAPPCRSDGRTQQLLDEIFCPNSLAFSPDGRTLYFTDTRKGEILQADVRPDRLELRPFAAADVAPGHPDGSTVDAEGCLWSTRTGGSAVVRLDQTGRVVSTLQLPVSQPTACAFGGPDLRTLYVTTARQKLTAEQLAAEPMAGDLFGFDVGVPGLPEHRFAG